MKWDLQNSWRVRRPCFTTWDEPSDDEEDRRVGLDERKVGVLRRRSQDDMTLDPLIPELAMDTSEQSDWEVGVWVPERSRGDTRPIGS